MELGVAPESAAVATAGEMRRVQHLLALGLVVFALIASQTEVKPSATISSVSTNTLTTPIEPLPAPTIVPLTQAEIPSHNQINESQNQWQLLERMYQVQKGDSLVKIARDFGTTLERIIKDNTILDQNDIKIGQQFKIQFPSYLESFLVGKRLPEEQKEALKDAIQQRYSDLDADDLYYFTGELDSVPRLQTGAAHIYGLDARREGLLERKSSGERFNPAELTCASWFYPLGTKLLITYTGPYGEKWPENHWKQIEVTVSDRGPDRHLLRYERDVIIDLTPAAAQALEPRAGIGPFKVNALGTVVQPTHLPDWWDKVPLPTQKP